MKGFIAKQIIVKKKEEVRISLLVSKSLPFLLKTLNHLV
jgi:hypothetical protein